MVQGVAVPAWPGKEAAHTPRGPTPSHSRCGTPRLSRGKGKWRCHPNVFPVSCLFLFSYSGVVLEIRRGKGGGKEEMKVYFSYSGEILWNKKRKKRRGRNEDEEEKQKEERAKKRHDNDKEEKMK